MKAILGNNVDVRALTETMLIEVKDIDETTDKKDILCAVQSQFDVELPPTRTGMMAYGNIARTAEQQYGAADSPLDTYRKGLPGRDTPERRLHSTAAI